MGNALDDIKNAADKIAGLCDEDGAAIAIEEALTGI
jgi:hydroxymethylpyrimidine pyrophosphatase-like HAD family hydrolase